MLAEIGGYLRLRGQPFIIMADWNMTLDEIGPACFDRYVQGEWVSAGDHPSGEKLIDYMLVSTSLRHAVKLS
eukprot:8864243-Pyramimonas_sp.AAC.1